MKRRLINRLESYRALQRLFADVDVAEIKGLPEALAAFSEELARVSVLQKRQFAPLAGALAERDTVLDELVLATLEIAGRVESFAHRSGLVSLARDVHVTPADFSRARLDRKVRLAEHVYHVTVEALPQIAEIGLTEADLAGFREKIAAARTCVLEPRAAIARRKVATEELEATFARISGILRHEIDPLMLPLSRKNRELFLVYEAARDVVHRRGRRRAAATEAATVQPAQAPDAPLTSEPAAVKVAA